MSTFRVRLTQGDRRIGGGNMDTQAQRTGAVTGASNASPIVITSTAHGLVTGTKVSVVGVVGNDAANGTWQVVVLSNDTFSLYQYQKSFLEPSSSLPTLSVGGQLLASEGNGAYTSGGTWNTLSVQRTVDAPGPNKKRRILHDGETFIDCNYWKQFAYPNKPYDEAFIEVVSDDGSEYVPGEESTFGRVQTLTVDSDTTYTDTGNSINVIDLYGASARFVQISVTGEDVTCRLNGSSSALLPISANTTQIFNSGDLPISLLEFDNSVSGGTTATVVVLVSVPSRCNS